MTNEMTRKRLPYKWVSGEHDEDKRKARDSASAPTECLIRIVASRICS